MMANHTRNWLLAAAVSLLVACGGGGGGDRAPGVEPGPPPSGGNVTPPEPEIPAPNPSPYAEAEQLFAFITAADIPEDGHATVEFQLSDANNTAIIDLQQENVRFVLSKLQASPLGNLTGSWQSYVNRIEQPGVGPGTEARLQATYERDGEFTNNGDGTYSYRFLTSVNDLPEDVLAQAEDEDISLDYEPDRTHRVAIQFDGSQSTANPNYDWVPTTGATEGIFTMDIAATENCNRCHDPLNIHGGNRREVKYCVTCHNPGSTDANSGNSVDMKVMIHKIHRGASLPSVQAGGEYAIWGFRDSKHDYSGVHYPQDIRNCENCHAGTATGEGRDDLVLTDQGDNWAEYSTAAVCGSCHDDVDFSQHAGGQPDDSNCASCHSEGGRAGSIASSHLIPTIEAGKQFKAEILAIDQTGPGEFPRVQYRVVDPTDGDEPYDLLNDPVWTSVEDGASRLAIDIGWDTDDYTNTGAEGADGNVLDHASTVSLNALAGTPNGDGSYTIESYAPVPDGRKAPGIAASGTGIVGIEGHPAVNVGTEEEPQIERIPFTNATEFFSIDEVDGAPTERRVVTELESCLGCHGQLSIHGNNRTDNLELCVACHNPRNTDRQVREVAQNPPTDGKDEESIDFKTMIHGIHAAAMRENPLQIVGFRGFTTYVYDEESVHYPGNLANCTACHTDAGYTLPLADTVLGTTVDTGDVHIDPSDDTVMTPATAACSSCHDDKVARSHMTSNGGSLATTQEDIDNEDVVEECSVCHREGKSAAVSTVHGL